MGYIDNRLIKVINAVKENTRIPIIVELVNSPGQSDISSLSSFMSISRVSSIVNQVYGSADYYGIMSLASLVFVSRIYYDEPVNKLGLPIITLSSTDIHIPVKESTDYIGCGELHKIGITGKGIKIAVIDTGVNRNHPMLKGAVTKSINIAKEMGSDNSNSLDGNGHGSHVASTAAGREVTIRSKLLKKDVTLRGAAPEASIISVKVLDDSGSGQTSWVMRGIEVAVEEGADIINMSLGSIYDGAGQSPDSKLVDKVVFDYNIPCCIAAGNSFSNFTIGSPGGAIGALTVASNSIKLPIEGMVSTFSSKGTTTDGRIKPDISAPGGNLLTVKEGIYAATAGGLAEEAGEEYISILGTSMATPHLTGALALLLQAGISRDRYYIEDLLAHTANFNHPKDVYTGWGIINILKAYNSFINKEELLPVSLMTKAANILISPLAAILPQQEQTIENTGIRLPYIK